ncbi:MAG: hypothetical protein AAF035_01175 [Pseudomonadota bacterium]
MKNVTITMDEHLLKATRVAAAEAGLSVSKFVARAVSEALEPKPTQPAPYGISEQRRLMEQFLSGPRLDGLLDENGKAPSRDEANAR